MLAPKERLQAGGLPLGNNNARLMMFVDQTVECGITTSLEEGAADVSPPFPERRCRILDGAGLHPLLRV